MDRILRMIMRRLVNKGLNSGMRAMSNRGRNGEQATPEERQRAQQGRQTGRNMRQASKLLRRISRF